MFEKASLILLVAAATGDAPAYPSVQCAASPAGWEIQSSGFVVTQAINRVDMKSNGTVLWNGSPVSDEQIAEYITLVASMKPQSFTILSVEPGVDCKRVKMVRQIIDVGANCRRGGLCGEGAGRWATSWNPRQQ